MMYPEVRLRRLRRTPALRRMARETRLTPDAFIAPFARWIVPIFFIVVGVHADLSGLAKPNVVALALGLTAAAAKRVVARRRTRPYRDLEDLVTTAKLGAKARAKLVGRAVGSVRAEVALLDAAVNNERIFSERPWGLVARFVARSHCHQ